MWHEIVAQTNISSDKQLTREITCSKKKPQTRKRVSQSVSINQISSSSNIPKKKWNNSDCFINNNNFHNFANEPPDRRCIHMWNWISATDSLRNHKNYSFFFANHLCPRARESNSLSPFRPPLPPCCIKNVVQLFCLLGFLDDPVIWARDTWRLALA